MRNIQNRIDNAVMQRQYAIEWNNQVNDPENDWSDKSSFIKREERKVPELVDQVVAKQIKEKFGTLRFYYDGGDEFIRGLDSMAASMSSVTCEVCGTPVKVVALKSNDGCLYYVTNTQKNRDI
jgi:hypothetical protein